MIRNVDLEYGLFPAVDNVNRVCTSSPQVAWRATGQLQRVWCADPLSRPPGHVSDLLYLHQGEEITPLLDVTVSLRAFARYFS